MTERRDRTLRGGGILTFVRADLHIWRRIDLECKNLETLCFELNMNKRKGGGDPLHL